MIRVRSSDELLQHTGQGDATPYTAQNYDYLFKALENKQAENDRIKKAKADRDAKLAEYGKYTPTAAWSPDDRQLQGMCMDYLGTVAWAQERARANGGVVSPQDDLIVKSKLQNIEFAKNKSLESQKEHQRVSNQIDTLSQQDNPLIDADSAKRALNDKVWDDNLNAYEISQRADPTEYNSVLNDPKHFLLQGHVNRWKKDLPEFTQEQVDSNKSDTLDKEFSKSVKSKFPVLTDKYGKIAIDPKTNQPVVNVTPAFKKNLLSSHPLAAQALALKMALPENKDKTEDEVIHEMVNPGYSYKDVYKKDTSTRAGSGEDDQAKIIELDNQKQNLNVNHEGGQTVTKGWVPKELLLQGKAAIKPIRVNSTVMHDQGANKSVTDEQGNPLVGDRDVTITRLQKLPVDKSSGHFINNDEAKVKELEKEGKIEYKWFANGTYTDQTDPNDKETKITKRVLIPYDEAKPEIKAKMKIDLDEMGYRKKSRTDQAIEAFTRKHGSPTAAQLEAIRKKYP